MNKNHYIAIMAGGIGSRFWPASSEAKPKQFLDVLGIGKSLIQMTFDRAKKIVPADHILIVTNEMYKNQVQQHLPDLPEENILCEPSRNNTAPCLAYCALHLEATNPNAVFGVLPADHVILKEDLFVQKMQQALEYASATEAIVTLGIQPTRPDTGYGYIQYKGNQEAGENPIYPVARFAEKPDLETAEQYLRSGDYFWNAGIFIWSVATLLQAFQQHAQDITTVLEQDKGKFGTAAEQAYINQVYPQTPSISVDYAILEKAKNVHTIPADIAWSDLGTWASLHDYLQQKEGENVIQANQYSLNQVHNCFIRVPAEKLIVVKGLEDFIVIDEDNVLLIYPKSDEQEIKKVRERFL